MFARIWVLLSMAVFRLWPLPGLWIYARHHATTNADWIMAFGLVMVLLVAQLSAARCSGDRLSHTHGLCVVGVAMSTGWTFLDAPLVPEVVKVTLLAPPGLAPLPRAPAHDLGLVQWVARHRMQQ